MRHMGCRLAKPGETMRSESCEHDAALQSEWCKNGSGHTTRAIVGVAGESQGSQWRRAPTLRRGSCDLPAALIQTRLALHMVVRAMNHINQQTNRQWRLGSIDNRNEHRWGHLCLLTHPCNFPGPAPHCHHSLGMRAWIQDLHPRDINSNCIIGTNGRWGCSGWGRTHNSNH